MVKNLVFPEKRRAS